MRHSQMRGEGHERESERGRTDRKKREMKNTSVG